MNLGRIREILRADAIAGTSLDREIEMVCACDVMSEVLSCAQIRSNSLLLTNLTHSQTVRTAEIAEISAICFVRGRKPDSQTLELAKKNDIVLLSTSFSLYESSGRLYREGIPGCSESKETR
ncbi:hypothetical protein E3J95_05685 [Candidatus Aerophobetes bacterium]|uniref:DRTGG domain-containing protein n=1 Tax=Aerophobetes bacterium TaxID=2030807 RepID=A0A523QHH4_UNCAE|nr:MAG: hypothetical protein E3J95_05685 [Candidatus Aerophobetes bacterium]